MGWNEEVSHVSAVFSSSHILAFSSLSPPPSPSLEELHDDIAAQEMHYIVQNFEREKGAAWRDMASERTAR